MSIPLSGYPGYAPASCLLCVDLFSTNNSMSPNGFPDRASWEKPCCMGDEQTQPLFQCRINTGPPSTTLAQRWSNIVPMAPVCCVNSLLEHFAAVAFNFSQQTSSSQQTRDIKPMLNQWWSTVYDADPTLIQHWANVSCETVVRSNVPLYISIKCYEMQWMGY